MKLLFFRWKVENKDVLYMLIRSQEAFSTHKT